MRNRVSVVVSGVIILTVGFSDLRMAKLSCELTMMHWVSYKGGERQFIIPTKRPHVKTRAPEVSDDHYDDPHTTMCAIWTRISTCGSRS